MRLSIRIWLLAIVYQVIIFAFMLDDVPLIAVVFIPIGFMGGLPGLFILDILLKRLSASNESIQVKWFYLILGSAFAAIVSASWPIILFGILFDHPSFEIMPTIPALTAAIVAVLSFAIPIQRLLDRNRNKDVQNLSTTNNIP